MLCINDVYQNNIEVSTSFDLHYRLSLANNNGIRLMIADAMCGH